jgi:hypothetical protein
MMAITALQNARKKKTSRAVRLSCVFAFLFLFSAVIAAHSQGRRMGGVRLMTSSQRHQSSPHESSSNNNNNQAPRGTTPQGQSGNGNGNASRQTTAPTRDGHLQDWINAHSNLTEEQKEQALRQDPGFKQYPPATQQGIIQRMRELNSMTPEQQQARTNSIETMERLSPQQRQQFSRALIAIGAMPEERQRLVRKAFRDLRDIPVEQRPAILNSEQFRSQFNDHERQVLNSLLVVAPYLPPARPSGDVQYGGK